MQPRRRAIAKHGEARQHRQRRPAIDILEGRWIDEDKRKLGETGENDDHRALLPASSNGRDKSSDDHHHQQQAVEPEKPVEEKQTA